MFLVHSVVILENCKESISSAGFCTDTKTFGKQFDLPPPLTNYVLPHGRVYKAGFCLNCSISICVLVLFAF